MAMNTTTGKAHVTLGLQLSSKRRNLTNTLREKKSICSILKGGKSGISPKRQVIQIVPTERSPFHRNVLEYNIKSRQMSLNLHFQSFQKESCASTIGKRGNYNITYFSATLQYSIMTGYLQLSCLLYSVLTFTYLQYHQVGLYGA